MRAALTSQRSRAAAAAAAGVVSFHHSYVVSSTVFACSCCHSQRLCSTSSKGLPLPPLPPLPEAGSSGKKQPSQHSQRSATGLPPPPGRAAATLKAKPKGLSSHKLPPPPPLSGTSLLASTTALPWGSPQEVLSAFIEFVPSFFVPVNSVAVLLPEDIRSFFFGRHKLLLFLRRYPFFFDVKDAGHNFRFDVKLNDSVNHPRRGAADEKFMLTDIGTTANYVTKPEYVVSYEALESVPGNVLLKPSVAPPSVHVRLEERVPVLDRLCALVPTKFVPITELEETLPAEILFHPYFDCQGGLQSIASKFPEHFQVVEGQVRCRPRYLAPLALAEYTLEDSPIPSVATLLLREVCASDIPYWVSTTLLYEQLSREEKREVKQKFKSFGGFIRVHGRALAISPDMLQVSMWVVPSDNSNKATTKATTTTTTPSSIEVNKKAVGGEDETGDAATFADSTSLASTESTPQTNYTQARIVNELYDLFPPGKCLTLADALELLPLHARYQLPKHPGRLAAWLASYQGYFSVENPQETDPTRVRLWRSSDCQPLSLALILYPHVPGSDTAGVEWGALLVALPETTRAAVERMGPTQLVALLPEWFALAMSNGDAVHICRLRSLEDLEDAIQAEQEDDL